MNNRIKIYSLAIKQHLIGRNLTILLLNIPVFFSDVCEKVITKLIQYVNSLLEKLLLVVKLYGRSIKNCS